MSELNTDAKAQTADKPSKKRRSAEAIDFTIKKIQEIKPPIDVDRKEYKDTKEQGLYLRVTKNGVMTFAYVGRPKGASKSERKTLGKFPIVKPEEARRLARELSGQQAAGESVSAQGRARRQEMKLSDLWEKYHTYLCASTKSPATSALIWKLYLGPKFGNRRLSDIHYSEVEHWHRELPDCVVAKRQAAIDAKNAQLAAKAAEIEARRQVRKHGPMPAPTKRTKAKPLSEVVTGQVTANRCVDVMRAMYNFAMHPKRSIYEGKNPAALHDHYDETARERFMEEEELAKFFQELATMSNETSRDAILASLLAGARKQNIHSMKWEDLHFGRQEWSLPAKFQKNKKSYVVPLVPELAALLERRKDAHDEYLRLNRPKTPQEKLAAQFVFPSGKSKTGHIVNIDKHWRQLTQKADIQNLRRHDLRRTMASWQAMTGSTGLIIGKALNNPSAVDIYARMNMRPVRDSMNTAASAMFEAAGLKSKGEVINLPPSAEQKRRKAS